MSFQSYVLYKLEGITMMLLFSSMLSLDQNCFFAVLTVFKPEFRLVALETSPCFAYHANIALPTGVHHL
jgi:hypothetical protein